MSNFIEKLKYCESDGMERFFALLQRIETRNNFDADSYSAAAVIK